MGWDPSLYLQFGAERTRAAVELLARIDLAKPARVADLGCGPGNSTALLAARWPDADLEGIDNSKDMLAEARRSGVQARWSEADVAQWTPRAPCDVIFSNATLQWVPGHEDLLPRLLSHLSPQGILAFQVPRNFDEASHALIRAVAAEGPWAGKLDAVRDSWNVLAPEPYYGILEPDTVSIDIWETRYWQVLAGEDAVYRWVSGTGLRPYANALEAGEREDFLAAYRARVAAAYPARESGATLFPFRRLFCVARK